MSVSIFPTATRLLTTELEALALALELELLPSIGQVPSAPLVIGSIGFFGKDLRGAITLAGAASTWDQLSGPIDSSLLADAAGEMANMVAGRFRNALLRRGVEIDTSIPIAVEGQLHDLRCPVVQHSTWHSFLSPSGALHVRFDVTFADSFRFGEDRGPEPLTAQLLYF